MFVILTYDVNQKRVGKVMKTCRKYLVHVQKSVFEGVIAEAKLNRLKKELEKIIDTDEDSICVYQMESLLYTKKDHIGVEIDYSHII